MNDAPVSSISSATSAGEWLAECERRTDWVPGRCPLVMISYSQGNPAATEEADRGDRKWVKKAHEFIGDVFRHGDLLCSDSREPYTLWDFASEGIGTRLGQHFPEQVAQKMWECRAAIIIFSQSYVNSPFCRDIELPFLLWRRRHHGTPLFILRVSATTRDGKKWRVPYGEPMLLEDLVDDRNPALGGAGVASTGLTLNKLEGPQLTERLVAIAKGMEAQVQAIEQARKAERKAAEAAETARLEREATAAEALRVAKQAREAADAAESARFAEEARQNREKTEAAKAQGTAEQARKDREAAEARRLSDQKTHAKEPEQEGIPQPQVEPSEQGFNWRFILICLFLFCAGISFVYLRVNDSIREAAAAADTAMNISEAATAEQTAAVAEEARKASEAAAAAKGAEEATAAQAEAAVAAESCDQAAMSPFDPRATPDRPGVDLSQIEATSVPVCRRAVELNAENVTLLFQFGRVLAANGQYLEAMQTLRAAAGRGSVESKNTIGLLYSDHPEVFIAAKDIFRCSNTVDCDQKAVTWFASAANIWDAEAQANLGWMYANQRGVRDRTKGANLNCTDYEDCDQQAVTWYAKAAEQGNALAQANLGWMYDSMRGVKGRTEGKHLNCSDNQDCFRQAVTWYAMAAKQGNALAQTNLGWMYDIKRGVTGRIEGGHLNCTDDEDCDRRAVTWYAKAVKQGNIEAMRMLAQQYRGRSGVTTIDDPALRCITTESCEAKAKALDEQRKALSP